MIFTFHNDQFLKIQVGDTILAIDPPVLDKGYKGSRFGADIVLSTSLDDNHRGIDTVTYGDRTPFRIWGPGDYEKGSMRIQGFHTRNQEEGKANTNTMYLIYWDGILIAVTGQVKHKDDITPNIREYFDEVDVAVVSLHSGDAEDVYKVAKSLSPAVIIPVGYEDVKDEAVKQFIDEGNEGEITDKFTTRKSDLAGRENDIIVLQQ